MAFLLWSAPKVPDDFAEKTAYKAFHLVFSAKEAGGIFAYQNKKERFLVCGYY